MSTPREIPRESRRIVWLVRTLTLVGLAVVVTTLVKVTLTLQHVRTALSRAGAEQAALAQTSTLVSHLTDAVRAEVSATLEETAPRPTGERASNRITDLVRTALDGQTAPDLRAALADVAKAAAGVHAVAQRADAWRDRYDVLWDDVSNDRTMGAVQAILADLQVRSGAITGRRRLADAIAYRQWRAAMTGPDAGPGTKEALAARIAEQQGRRERRGQFEFNRGLAEVSRLVEAVGGEDKIDALSDLAANRMTPAVDRIARAVAGSKADPADADVAIPPEQIVALRRSIFGRAPGPDGAAGDGLFAVRRRSLRLTAEQKALKTEVVSASHVLYECGRQFTAIVQTHAVALTDQVERSLSAGRENILVLGLGCSGLFLYLSVLISRDIRGQVAGIQAARADAENDRKLAQDRLVQQQKAEAELRAAQDQLVTTSRQAGMAEVATGVLHNVGNVLNSVNVSVHLIKDKVQASPVAKLTKTADLMDAHAEDLGTFLTSDARGKHIPGYVSKLARLLGGENAWVAAEVENLSRGIDHIKQVVQFQQNYAKPSTLCELLNPAELLEDALRLNLIALDRHGVTIVREVADTGPVRIDKHKTLQILVNLISNAKNAMKDLNANRERRLTLGVGAVPVDGGLRLKIWVRDNGVGIAPEHLSRIFSHGFTTRAEGHGFGLHSAINAAREMGGTLDVFSAGPDQGATFTLEIPVVAREAAAREIPVREVVAREVAV